MNTHNKKTDTALVVSVLTSSTKPEGNLSQRYKRRDTTARFRLHDAWTEQVSGTNVPYENEISKLLSVKNFLQSRKQVDTEMFIDMIGRCFAQNSERERKSRKVLLKMAYTLTMRTPTKQTTHPKTHKQ